MEENLGSSDSGYTKSSGSTGLAADMAMQEEMYLEGSHWSQAFLLGTGAFSKCYQARDVRTGTLMAVKQIILNRGDGDESEQVIGPF